MALLKTFLFWFEVPFWDDEMGDKFNIWIDERWHRLARNIELKHYCRNDIISWSHRPANTSKIENYTANICLPTVTLH